MAPSTSSRTTVTEHAIVFVSTITKRSWSLPFSHLQCQAPESAHPIFQASNFDGRWQIISPASEIRAGDRGQSFKLKRIHHRFKEAKRMLVEMMVGRSDFQEGFHAIS